MQKTLNLEALKSFLLYGYIKAPFSVYEGIYKLLPGHIITFFQDGTYKDEVYWSLDNVIKDAKLSPYKGTDEQAINDLQAD